MRKAKNKEAVADRRMFVFFFFPARFSSKKPPEIKRKRRKKEKGEGKTKSEGSKENHPINR